MRRLFALASLAVVLCIARASAADRPERADDRDRRSKRPGSAAWTVTPRRRLLTSIGSRRAARCSRTRTANLRCATPRGRACSRASRPSSTGIYGLAPWFRNVPELSKITTLPQHFSKEGYRTYSTGKIYHGGYGRRKTDREFDVLGPGAGVGARPNQKLVTTPYGHPLMDWGFFPHPRRRQGRLERRELGREDARDETRMVRSS